LPTLHRSAPVRDDPRAVTLLRDGITEVVMWGITGTRLQVLALIGIMIASGACGGSSGHARSLKTPSAKDSSSGGIDLGRFLMQRNEEPGFSQGAAPGATPRTRQTITGLSAFAASLNLPTADEQRLGHEGFVSFTVSPIRAPGTAGVTNVALFETAAGAEQAMAHDLTPAAIRAFGPIEGLQYFAVPGISGARGWTATKPHVGNVLWVEGRCYLTLGNEGPGPFVGPLSEGARAIYTRTNGQCP
jgi:hypothetical protein